MDNRQYLSMDMLRFITAGSVDDGKSTLIGRLLFDSKSIFEDQLEAIQASSERRGDGYTNLALLTDGLKAEREQGITIDVAYKYFATPKRKFIIADTPGHIQYTRNMVTGASTADLALILIDARKGVIEQTLRHSFLTAMIGIPHLVICINKMDLVDFSETIYNDIQKHYFEFANRLNIPDVRFIPISALNGDNVVERSKSTPWYKGETLLELLENIQVFEDMNLKLPRFPVQWVIRPMSNEYHDYRGYAGSVASGIFKKGDRITVFPNGQKGTIKSIQTFEGEIEEAYPPLSVSILLNEELDISRGDIIAAGDLPVAEQEFETYVCWMDTKPLNVNGKYLLQHTTASCKCVIKEILYKLDTNHLKRTDGGDTLELNEIARVVIKTSKPVVFDDYAVNRPMGSFIIIDEGTNNTSGAGIIRKKEIV